MLLLVLALFFSMSAKAGLLTDEQIEQLGVEEQWANAFLDGFRMEDINPMFYTCLWESFTMRR